MKKAILGICVGVAMALVWSVIFVNLLNSMAGIGVGICFGGAFGFLSTLIFSQNNKNK